MSKSSRSEKYSGIDSGSNVTRSPRAGYNDGSLYLFISVFALMSYKKVVEPGTLRMNIPTRSPDFTSMQDAFFMA